MSDSENYWTRRLARQGLSRRRFVGGAAVTGLGAATMALVGCGDDDDDDDDGNGGVATATTAPSDGSPTAEPTPSETAMTQGGTARFTSAGNTWDTFDIDRSRFTPVSVLFGYTNLGVLQWKSYTDGVIEGAMAESYEQGADDSVVFTVRPGVTWHDRAPVNGREATAEDIAYFMERNIAGVTLDGMEDPNFYRKAAFQTVDKVEVVDATHVKVTFKRPDPFFLNVLAGAYAKVQAREAVEQFEGEYQNLKKELIIGTGAFTVEDFAAEGTLTLKRFDGFHSPVNYDGIQYLNLFTDQAAQQAAFEQKELDVFSPTSNAVIEDLLTRLKDQITERRVFSANPQAGTYYGGAAPWNNPNLIGAIFRALNRRDLIQSLLQGKGVLSGNVPPTQSAFGIDEGELITFPGYLEDRAKDEAEAKAMWEAGGGAALGDVTVDIPDIWEGLYSGGASLITSNLNRVLGNTFTARIEPYSTITTKIVNQQYGNGNANTWWGWITEITDPEPSLLLYLTHNSAQPQFAQYGVKIDAVDSLTNSLVTEFDIAKRQEMAKDVNRELLKAYGAGVHYSLVGVSSVLNWNYYHPAETAPFVTSHMVGTDAWLDSNDPTWQGRKA